MRVVISGYRYYLPEIGRWLNRDPLGEDGGLNLYVFMGNNSISSIDLFGLVSALPALQDIQIRRIDVSLIDMLLHALKIDEGDGLGHWWFQFNDESYGWWPKGAVNVIKALSLQSVEGELNGMSIFWAEVLDLYRALVIAGNAPGPITLEDATVLKAYERKKEGFLSPSGTRDYHHGHGSPTLAKRADKGELKNGTNNTIGKACQCATEDEIKECIRDFANKYRGKWSLSRSCHTFVKEGKKACCLTE